MEKQLKICKICQNFQPGKLDGWGQCSLEKEIFGGPQKLSAEFHNCEHKGSRWQAIGGGSSSSTASSPTSSANTTKTLPKNKTTPAWVGQCIWGGIIGLVFAILFLPVDVFVGIPVVPEFSILIGLVSFIALCIGIGYHLFS